METSSDITITLHWLERSRAHRVLWLLEELKIPYVLKTYKRGSDRLADPKLKEIHPLGKSPVITVEAPGLAQPLVLAESGAIVEYLCDHYGKWLIPKRYKEGKEDQVGGETESWIRYRYYMHYAEGSVMPLMVMSLVVERIRNAPVPFFIKPITYRIAGMVSSGYLQPNFETHYRFIEGQLESSPDGGDFLCGKELTAADIMMSFPMDAGRTRSGMKEECPIIWAYVDQLLAREAYQRAVKKIIEVDGKFDMTL